MLETPPLLRGSEQEQLTALRDYLVRLARSLDGAQLASAPASSASAAPSATVAAADAGKRAGELRSLIVKTADTLNRRVERLSATLTEDYFARSDFGSYQETLRASFEATARGVVESYDFDAALAALSGRAEEAERALRSLRGEIRRGLITDPETGETAMGIAVAENLRFTGAQQSAEGLIYYELAPGQTLGLYTASGWQFWLGGVKRGWFDALDGMLHAAELAVERRLTLSGGWIVTADGGFGLRVSG